MHGNRCFTQFIPAALYFTVPLLTCKGIEFIKSPQTGKPGQSYLSSLLAGI